jgi:hypothetical protein
MGRRFFGLAKAVRIFCYLCVLASIMTIQSAGKAYALDEKTNPFDRHNLTLTNGAGNDVFGWIELTNGRDLAGYIYLVNGRLREPFLSTGKVYIVMDMPMAMLGTLLDLLRNEKALQIRYFKSDSGRATAFLERPLTNTMDAEMKRRMPLR